MVNSILRYARALAKLGYEADIEQPYKELAEGPQRQSLTPAGNLVAACESFLDAVRPLEPPLSGWDLPTLERWGTSVRVGAEAQSLEETRVVNSLIRMVADPGGPTELQVIPQEGYCC